MHDEKYGLSVNYHLLGEGTEEEELNTLHIHFKTNCPVLIPKHKVLFCLSVQVVTSDFECGILTQKD